MAPAKVHDLLLADTIRAKDGAPAVGTRSLAPSHATMAPVSGLALLSLTPMHEFGIAQHLVEAVTAEMAARPGARLLRAHVTVGALRRLVPDSLAFAYATLTRDTPLAGSTLDLTVLPVVLACPQCGWQGAPPDGVFHCPTCHTRAVDTTQGTELCLDRLIVDEQG
jgi:hydrogenase nickel incorporation protein HypA/HybF